MARQAKRAVPAAKSARRKSRAAAKPKAPAKAPLKKNKGGKASREAVARKIKTIRDSFNMPAEDYALIAELKERALATARAVKKSELLRAGIRVLSRLSDEAFSAALSAVPAVKTGRPGKKHKS
jgi:hypothetical protein